MAQTTTLDQGLKALVETIQKFCAVLCLIMIVVAAMSYSKGDTERALHLFGAAALAGMAWVIVTYFFGIGGASTPF